MTISEPAIDTWNSSPGCTPEGISTWYTVHLLRHETLDKADESCKDVGRRKREAGWRVTCTDSWVSTSSSGAASRAPPESCCVAPPRRVRVVSRRTMGFLESVHLYRKVPADLTDATRFGGVIPQRERIEYRPKRSPISRADR